MKRLIGMIIAVLSCLWVNAYAEDFEALIDFPPRFELSLPVSGLVDTVKVTAGQRVKKGEIMLSLDETPFKAERTLMQARVALHQARLSEAKRDFDHQQELFDRTVLSTVDLENAELRVKRDTAMLESAKAMLKHAEYEFSHSQLKAPFDALVMSVQVNEGQAINNTIQSKILVSLVRQGHYIARFNAGAEQLDKINIDMPVKVVISGTQYAAKISAISYASASSYNGSAISGENHYSVEAGFIVENGSLPVGQKASVVIDR